MQSWARVRAHRVGGPGYNVTCAPASPLTADRQATATELVMAWARFAATGDPGWPAWSGTGAIRTVTAAGAVDRPAAEYAADHHCDLWNP